MAALADQGVGPTSKPIDLSSTTFLPHTSLNPLCSHRALLRRVDSDGGIDEEVVQLAGLRQVRVPHHTAVLQLSTTDGHCVSRRAGISYRAANTRYQSSRQKCHTRTGGCCF